MWDRRVKKKRKKQKARREGKEVEETKRKREKRLREERERQRNRAGLRYRQPVTSAVTGPTGTSDAGDDWLAMEWGRLWIGGCGEINLHTIRYNTYYTDLSFREQNIG